MSNLDWGNLGFGYRETNERYVSNFKNGAWDAGTMTKDDTVTITWTPGEQTDVISDAILEEIQKSL